MPSKISVGEAFQESLRPFMRELTNIFNKISEFAKTPFGQTMIKWTAGIAAATAGLVAMGFIFTVLLPAMGSMILASGKLLFIMSPYVAVIGAIVYVLYQAAQGMRAMATLPRGLEFLVVSVFSVYIII